MSSKYRTIAKNLYNRYQKNLSKQNLRNKIVKFISTGQHPWSEGYTEYKQQYINASLQNHSLLNLLLAKKVPAKYGVGLDDRVVEYPWIFTYLSKEINTFLDAGSTFNYKYIVSHPLVASKSIYIATYFPENLNFNEKRISYVYCDLRELPFRDGFFEEIVCQSTLEHIDMDNSMYGYHLKNLGHTESKSYAYMLVLKELIRVLQIGGTLLLTFPFGKFENHGFFQQFDSEMLQRMKDYLISWGRIEVNDFFKYTPTGWIFSNEQDGANCESYNPHTGRGKGTDGAAHSRAICCIKFIKTT